MRRPTRLSIALVAGMTAFLVAAPASATTSPTFTSDFSMTATVWGQTHFTVSGGTGVHAYVTMNGTGMVTSSAVTVVVQRQVCGTFGCNWRDQPSAYQGGTCTIYPKQSSNVGKQCNFKVEDSTRLHRLVIDKAAHDGATYSGTVSVS